MSDKQIPQQHHTSFESIKHSDAKDHEYWLARTLAKVLDYSQYRHFSPSLERAREACLNSGPHVETIWRMSSQWPILVLVRGGNCRGFLISTNLLECGH